MEHGEFATNGLQKMAIKPFIPPVQSQVAPSNPFKNTSTHSSQFGNIQSTCLRMLAPPSHEQVLRLTSEIVNQRGEAAAKLTDLEGKLKAANYANSQLTQQVAHLNDDKDNNDTVEILKEKEMTLEEAKANAKKEKIVMKEEISKLRAENIQLAENYNESVQKVESLSNKLQKLEDAKEHEAKMTALKEENDKLRAENVQLTCMQRMGDLSRELNEARRQLDDMKQCQAKCDNQEGVELRDNSEKVKAEPDHLAEDFNTVGDGNNGLEPDADTETVADQDSDELNNADSLAKRKRNKTDEPRQSKTACARAKVDYDEMSEDQSNLTDSYNDEDSLSSSEAVLVLNDPNAICLGHATKVAAAAGHRPTLIHMGTTLMCIHEYRGKKYGDNTITTEKILQKLPSALKAHASIDYVKFFTRLNNKVDCPVSEITDATPYIQTNLKKQPDSFTGILKGVDIPDDLKDLFPPKGRKDDDVSGTPLANKRAASVRGSAKTKKIKVSKK